MIGMARAVLDAIWLWVVVGAQERRRYRTFTFGHAALLQDEVLRARAFGWERSAFLAKLERDRGAHEPALSAARRILDEWARSGSWEGPR